ncbi:MAG: hypothetical protein WBB76_12245 [Gaiellaceae bacterium]
MRHRPPRQRGRPIARRAAAIAAGLVVGGLLASPAGANRSLFVGVDDNAFLASPDVNLPVAKDLGVKAVRVTLDHWYPGDRTINTVLTNQLTNLVTAAPGLRVVVSVYAPSPVLAPVTAAYRDNYCNYLGSILKNVPAINDFVIWNEPNLSYFWKPQFNPNGSSAAPAAYEALLARCYDVLHAIRPGVNVIAPATCPRGNDIPWAPENVSHSPGQFILGMGGAYRASGRSQPLFDTVGHHVYGTYAAERPWRVHSNSTAISEGDWRALVDSLSQAFGGTAQQTPGCSGGSCMAIWYLEAGYQTTIDRAKAKYYWGAETFDHLVPAAGGPPDPPDPAETSWAPDQATQLRDGIRLAYCQPYVEAFFNFLLRDDANLAGWQSGVLWVDGTPKPSYPAFKQAIGDVGSGKIDCGGLKGNQVPAGATAHPGGGGQSPSSASARRRLRLVLSVRPRVRAGEVLHVWLRFNRVVKNERVRLLQRSRKQFVVMMRRRVSGFAPALKLRRLTPGRYTIRVAYQDGSVYRYTQAKTFAVVPRRSP